MPDDNANAVAPQGIRARSAAPRQAAVLEMGQQQYLHLVRLAWDLCALGVSSAVELGPGRVPVVRIARARGPVRVMAWDVNGAWVFTWGHSQKQRVEVFDARAVSRIAGLAQDD